MTNSIKFMCLMMATTIIHSEKSAALSVSCSDADTCHVDSMPNYDQNTPALLANWNIGNGTTNLCGPAAMDNLLISLMSSGSVPKEGTFSAVLKSRVGGDAKILFTASPLGTTKTGGTTNVALGNFLATRSRDFVQTMTYSNIYKSSSNTIDQTTMNTQMHARRIPIVLVGNYKPACTNLANGHVRCTYTRKLGHFMAQSDVDGNKVKFHDSRTATVYSTAVNLFPAKDPVSGKILEPVLPSYFTKANVRRIGVATDLWLIEGLFSMGQK